MSKLIIDIFDGVYVVRDDKVVGGVKMDILAKNLDQSKEVYVFASTPYGVQQINLAKYMKIIEKKLVIFTSMRKKKHPHTLRAEALGATIREVQNGYLDKLEDKAKKYARQYQYQLLQNGVKTLDTHEILIQRAVKAFTQLQHQPNEIFVPIGDTSLFRALCDAVQGDCVVYGVNVNGRQYTGVVPDNAKIIHYPLPFKATCQTPTPFKSTPTYAAKAWEMCLKYKNPNKMTMFWNEY